MVRIWHRAICSLLLGLLPVCSLAGDGVSVDDFDFGPFVTRDVTLDGHVRVRALGPLFEWQSNLAQDDFRAVRPFYARVAETNTPRVLSEIVWPVCTLKEYRNEFYWRVLIATGRDYEMGKPSRYKNHIYPFFFQGESRDGDSYFAVFPIGGVIREFLARDHVSFVLFPLYMRSQVNESVTYDVIWPLVSWAKHDAGRSWRIFPFYGQAEVYDAWKRRFVMWPIWTSVDFDKVEGGGFILFPVCGYSRIQSERTWWVVPPLCKWKESPEGRAVNCPWPFFQYETGAQEKLYLWPLWGTREKGATKNTFYLWPIFHRSVMDLSGRKQTGFRAIPFVYADKTVERKDGKEETVSHRYFKLWPLFSYRRDGDASRFRSLELWPMKHTAPVERNFAPFWTIYTREKSGGSRDTELLWGLYRSRKGENGDKAFSIFPLYSSKRKADPVELSSWKILAGLFGREVEDGVRKWQVLYFIRFGNRKVAEQ